MRWYYSDKFEHSLMLLMVKFELVVNARDDELADRIYKIKKGLSMKSSHFRLTYFVDAR